MYHLPDCESGDWRAYWPNDLVVLFRNNIQQTIVNCLRFFQFSQHIRIVLWEKIDQIRLQKKGNYKIDKSNVSGGTRTHNLRIPTSPLEVRRAIHCATETTVLFAIWLYLNSQRRKITHTKLFGLLLDGHLFLIR